MIKLLTQVRFLAPLAAVVSILLAAATISAQYQVASWTTDNGLPQNTVHSIVQTPDGYLWLATLDGLVRFDGSRFTVFNKNNTPGISGNRFTQVIIDTEGNLWAATENSGVTRYRDGAFQSYSVPQNNHNEPIWNLVLNASGKLVVFTVGGIVEWDGETFMPYRLIAGETNEGIVWWSRSGEFWYGSGQTVYRVKDHQIKDYRLPGKPVDAAVNKLVEDSRGRIWIGTKNAGLFVIDHDNLIAYTVKDGLPSNEISPRIEDRDGNLWAITGQGAVIINDGKISRLTTAEGLSDDPLATVYQDREGNVWIGTLSRGLNRINRNSVTFYSKKDGLAADTVNPIYQDRQGTVWIGGRNLTRYRNGRFSFVAGRENQNNGEVTAIEQDREDRLWFGHWGGAYFYENGKFTDFTEKFGQKVSVTDINEDREGNLWFASNKGVFRYQNGEATNLTTHDGLVSDDCKVILETRDGAIWIGAYGGLTRLKDGVFNSLTMNDGLASNQVRSLYEDSEGVLWIGSYDGGLTRLKDGRLTRYTTREGLFNNGVFQILEDASGNFWMSSNRGIYRASKKQLNDFADGQVNYIETIAYGKADGMLETECNGGQQPAGIKTSDGKLWFPTQRGVAVIDPETIKKNPFIPPVIIESALVDGQSVSLNDGIEVAPGKNNLEIVYTGLSFVKPEFVKFRYKLEGQDANWIEAGTRRTAYYSYLPPGDYIFTVLAANSDGVWNIEGKQIRVHVVSPFYRTFWFTGLSLMVFFGIVFSGYRFRLRQIEKKHYQQEMFSRRLIDSQEQERKRIAVELHDSLGQQLLVIKNWAMLEIVAKGEDTPSRQALGEISETASQAIEEVREIIYDLRPYQLDKIGLRKTLLFMVEKISAASGLEFTTEIGEIDNLFDYDSEIVLYRIVQECLNNIVKHSQANAAVVIIERSAQIVNLRIEDNGRGFTPDFDSGSKSNGFGLTGIAERVRMLGGHRTITTAPGGGTKIFISIPVSKNNELRD